MTARLLGLALLLALGAAFVVPGVAAESPWGGPIRPPKAEDAPASRDLSGTPVPTCMVGLKICDAPPDAAVGGPCFCDVEGTAMQGVVRRIRRPSAKR